MHIAGNRKGFVWDLRGSGEEAHAYTNPKDGYVWGTAWHQVNGRLRLGINRPWGYSRLTISALHKRIQVPTGSRDSTGHFIFKHPVNGRIYPTNDDFLSYSANIASDKLLDEYQAWWQNSINLGNGKLGLGIGFTRSAHFDVDSGTVGTGNFAVNDIPFSLNYQVEEANTGIQLTSGINGTYEMERNFAEARAPYISNFQIPNYKNFEIGGYAIIEKDFKDLTLNGGIRFDRTKFIGDPLYLADPGMPQQRIVSSTSPGAMQQFAGFDNIYSGFSGSIGASYQLPGNNYAKLNISRRYRAPAINELTNNGLNIGSNAVQLVNIDLQAEHGYQFDLAYGYNGNNLSFEANGFYNHIDNFIFTNKTDSVSQGYPVYQFTSANVAVITGISGYLNIHPVAAKCLEIDNGFTYVYSHIPNTTDSTRHLTYIPAPHLTSDLKFRFNNGHNSTLSETFVKIGVQHSWAQNNIYRALHTEVPSSPYTLFSAGVGITFTNPKTGRALCSLYVNCTNLTNAAYADHLNIAQYFLSYNGQPVTVTRQNQGIYNMGRNISFKNDCSIWHYRKAGKLRKIRK